MCLPEGLEGDLLSLAKDIDGLSVTAQMTVG